MCQRLILDYLKYLRSLSDDFHGVNEITDAMRDKYPDSGWHTVRGSLIKLELSGFTESITIGRFSNWNRKFRYKKV